LNFISLTNIFAIWPGGLRTSVDKETDINQVHVSHFDILDTIDKIEQKGEYDLFRETVCDILDLEDLDFAAEDIGPSAKKDKDKKAKKRVRHCTIKRIGNGYSDISEYSDGTFSIAGILAALFSKERRRLFFCLEELENCLHPAALEKLLRFLKDNSERWPVLITTHSPYLLSKVNPADVNISTIDEDGAVHFNKVTDRKKINALLNNKYINFGDLLVSNFEELGVK